MEQQNYSLEMIPNSWPPRLEGIDCITREEQGRAASNPSNHDAAGGKPSGSPATDVARDQRARRRCTKNIKIGTWNVRSLNLGKLDVIKREMTRTNIDILGISELRWSGNGFFQSDDFQVYYSGNVDNSRNGVAIIVNKRLASTVESFRTSSDRVIAIRFRAKPMNVTILQIYAPTTDASEDVIEAFYCKVQETLDHTPRKDIVYVLGDFNAKVGEGPVDGVVGSFGLGERNEAGDRFVQFCQENRLRITNTWFIQHKRRLYTWTSPNNLYRNQIDYILCSQRWASSVLSAKTLPGADCGSDHELLFAKVRLRLCNIKKNIPARRLDLEKVSPQYSIEIKNRFEALDFIDRVPDELWEDVKNIITQTASQHIPTKKPAKKAKWLTEDTIKIADHRRKAKSVNDVDGFRRLNAEFQRAARQDKEKYWKAKCKELEENNRLGHTRNLFAQVKKIRSPFSGRQGPVKDSNGREIGDRRGVRKRWKEYTEKLYANDRPGLSGVQFSVLQMEPNILEAEVVWAMTRLTKRKAPGIDEIPAELLAPVPVKVFTSLCREIWRSGSWPKDWKRSIFIPLHKKGDPRECSNYRTIALISHASKIMLKIIQQRLRNLVDLALPDVQAGFRKGRGTRDHIANLRWIMERTREFKKDIYMCFIDYVKAFDCVEHDKLWKTLKDLGVPEHLVRLIRSLYDDQEATVRTQYGDTEWFRIGRGVRQGCILSPFLFNLYAEMIMRKLDLEESAIGVKIGGRNINNLRYADDTTLLAETEEDLEQLILRVEYESAALGLHLNVKKTKIMTTADNVVNVKINGVGIENVQDFIFLGSKIVQNGDSCPEIKRRIALGRGAMMSMVNIWKSKDIHLTTKCKIVRAIVFPISTYGCESWTLRKADRRRIDAFELWCWRRLLRIPWTAGVTNREVLNRVQAETSLEGKITKLRLTFFGHIMRANGLEKDIMLGKVSGKRRPGRQRMRWLDTIKTDTNLNLQQLKEMVLDRVAWKRLSHEVAEGRTRLNG